MKRIALVAAGLALAACAPPQVVAPRTAGLQTQKPDEIPNLEVVVFEVVDSAEEDGVSFTAVSVDGVPSGKTTAGPRSSEKIWSARVAPGNHLLRMEHWSVGPEGEATRLNDDLQPRERFVRVDAATKSRVSLRVSDQGRRQEQTLTREKLPD